MSVACTFGSESFPFVSVSDLASLFVVGGLVRVCFERQAFRFFA